MLCIVSLYSLILIGLRTISEIALLQDTLLVLLFSCFSYRLWPNSGPGNANGLVCLPVWAWYVQRWADLDEIFRVCSMWDTNNWIKFWANHLWGSQNPMYDRMTTHCFMPMVKIWLRKPQQLHFYIGRQPDLCILGVTVLMVILSCLRLVQVFTLERFSDVSPWPWHWTFGMILYLTQAASD